MRSVEEIREFAESKNMEIDVRDRGTSYRAGGDILCYPKGFDWRNAEVSIKHEKDFGFEGTGYAGRGRSYDLWIIVPARSHEKKYVLAEYTKYYNVAEDKRLSIGKEEGQRSGCDALYFIEPNSDQLSDLSGLFDGWTE